MVSREDAKKKLLGRTCGFMLADGRIYAGTLMDVDNTHLHVRLRNEETGETAIFDFPREIIVKGPYLVAKKEEQDEEMG